MKPLSSSIRACRQIAAGVGYCSPPAFLILGAQKAGTTALTQYLSGHPSVFPARRKELHYFDVDANYQSKSIRWYHAQFPLPYRLPRDGVTFEATPAYLFEPKCARRIAEYRRQLQLIAILRDPVERAISAWRMHGRFFRQYGKRIVPPTYEFDAATLSGFEALVGPGGLRHFDEVIEEEIAAIQANRQLPGPCHVRRGLYAEQLERYFKLFNREQLLILESAQLREQTSRVLEKVRVFLHLRDYKWPPSQLTAVNQYEDEPVDVSVAAARLQEFYRPHNRALEELLGRRLNWHR